MQRREIVSLFDWYLKPCSKNFHSWGRELNHSTWYTSVPGIPSSLVWWGPCRTFESWISACHPTRRMVLHVVAAEYKLIDDITHASVYLFIYLFDLCFTSYSRILDFSWWHFSWVVCVGGVTFIPPPWTTTVSIFGEVERRKCHPKCQIFQVYTTSNLLNGINIFLHIKML